MIKVRLLLRSPIFVPKSIFQRTIMTSESRAEKAMEDLSKNAYYAKYAEKIAKLQQTAPDEFLSRVDQLEKAKTPPKKAETPKPSDYSQLLNPKKPLKEAEPQEASLEQIMKLELVQDKTSEEIKEIWREYHLHKDVIAAVIPAEDFEELSRNSKTFPIFLFPLPRKQGYEFIMCQFDKKSVHFTPLLYYQVHKENAPECLTMTHFTELQNTKDIVLMRGEYDAKIIDLKEALCLANQLQLYYVKPDADKLRLLKEFSDSPDQFKHMELIKQIENLSL